MIRKYFLPVFAVLGILLGIRTTQTSVQSPPPAEPVAAPSRDPFEHSVAGSGIVEGVSENVRIAPLISGVVVRIPVKIGQRVSKGDILFELDSSQAAADVASREAAVAVADAELRSAQALYGLWAQLTDKRAISEEDRLRRKFAVETAAANLKLRHSELLRSQVSLNLHSIRAPFDGSVLQIKTRVGEFAPSQSTSTSDALMLFSDISTLQVRVDTDESDAWRLGGTPKAVAFVRGNPDLKTDLNFVRFEPYVVPKRALTGESSERVDTRVLQVVFNFPAANLSVYPGQLMDVFIEGKAFR